MINEECSDMINEECSDTYRKTVCVLEPVDPNLTREYLSLHLRCGPEVATIGKRIGQIPTRGQPLVAVFGQILCRL
jgi:hypothetical protein